MCSLQKHLCRAPRLIRGCLREAAGDSSSTKHCLMQRFICVSSCNLTLQPGEWGPKCGWHISTSQSQAFPTSCSLLHWQYFPRANWSHLPKVTQAESSQKALFCALICGTAPFGPKLDQAGALDYNRPEHLTLIYILPHLTELPFFLLQNGGNVFESY